MMLSLRRENFLKRFEFDPVLSVRICYEDSLLIVAIAESSGHSKS